MPDFNIVAYYHCITAEHFHTQVTGSKGDKYDVEYGPTVSGPYEYDWSCTCPSFKFRGKCKHIEGAKKKVCGWMQFTEGGEPVEVNGEKRCPKCGEEVSVRNWAV